MSSFLKGEFYEHLHQLFSLVGLFNPKFPDGVDSKIIQYILGLDEPIPDKILLELIKTVLVPKLPIDDSKLELEKFIKGATEIPPILPIFNEISPMLERLVITQLWTDIVKPPIMIAGDAYRKPDGSNYSRSFQFLGKANSKYALTSHIRNPIDISALPKASDIFDKVMLQEGGFVEHPSGISSMLFYLAILITHDLFHSNMADYNINQSSSYLDLTPLYGNGEKQLNPIRTFKHGLLKEDTFADSRILLQPPGVVCLLLVFSRNHNYIAKKLLEINEQGRFSVKDENNPEQVKKQDEDLFQTSRLINCGFYINIILHNYIRTILGLEKTNSTWSIDPKKPYPKSGQLQALPTGIGNLVSLEFNFIYRWHPAVNKDDLVWIESEFKRILGDDWEDSNTEEFRKKMKDWALSIDKDPAKWTFSNFERDNNNYFKDSDIARELIDGTKKVAGSFGANRISSVFRPVELLGIEMARDLGLCSLNDFRQSLNLVPYKSFEELNPDSKVANKLRELYGDVNNVELYPGLMSEKTKPADLGSAIALPFTISRAILSDAVNLVRNDRFYTDDFSPRTLTSWGWKEVQSDPSDLASGGILHKLLFRFFPDYYKENSALAYYPFTIPSQTKKNLEGRGDIWKKFDYDG